MRHNLGTNLRQTVRVTLRSKLLTLLAIAALIVSACSSTTVVARNERPSAVDGASAADASTSDGAAPSESSADTDDDDASVDLADEDAAEDAADDRGSREGAEPTTPRELEEEQGFGLGGAEQLQGLLVDCEGGSDMACDILFELSAFDSDEENAALTCGGRAETAQIFCTEGVSAIPDELVFDEDSEGLDVIVEACEDDGDMTACDFLYFRSPFESTYEEIGATCGGRVQVAVPDCRTFIDQ